MKSGFLVVLGGLALATMVGLQQTKKQIRRIPRLTRSECTSEEKARAIQRMNSFASMLGLPQITDQSFDRCLADGVEGEVTVSIVLKNRSMYKDDAEGWYAMKFTQSYDRGRSWRPPPALSKERLLQIATMYRNRLKTDRKLVFTGEAPQIKSEERSYYGPMPTNYKVYWEERVAGYAGTAALSIALEPHTGELKSLGWGYSPYDKPKHELLRQSQAIEIAKKYVAEYRKDHPYPNYPQFPKGKRPPWYKNRSAWSHHTPNFFVGEYYDTIPRFVKTKRVPLRMIHTIYYEGKNQHGDVMIDVVEVDAETGKVVGGLPALGRRSLASER